jgi:hypothetical protein
LSPPLGGRRVPYLWANSERAGHFDLLEQSLRERTVTRRGEALTGDGDSVLYSVEWRLEKATFPNGIVDTAGFVDADA